MEDAKAALRPIWVGIALSVALFGILQTFLLQGEKESPHPMPVIAKSPRVSGWTQRGPAGADLQVGIGMNEERFLAQWSRFTNDKARTRKDGRPSDQAMTVADRTATSRPVK